MTDENALDEMFLPLANPKEELESISKNRFIPLFKVSQFEVRAEEYKDKGIDYFIELKNNSRHTNFRFAVQLKATEAIPKNKDGSISLKIHTYNINYLLNGGDLAYYILYYKPEDRFYASSLNDFLKSIYSKNEKWGKQESHVLRFKVLFDEDYINDIYKDVLEKGRFQRRINEKMALKSAELKSGSRITFDGNFDVIDDCELREMIEVIGFDLINEGRWREIIFAHKKATGNVASTAKYNLILGIANYYRGHYLDALSFFRNSKKIGKGLTEYEMNHRKYFEIVAKYSVGMLSKEEYEKRLEGLELLSNVGLYVKIEKARDLFSNILLNKEGLTFQSLIDYFNVIIDAPESTENVKLLAKCELAYYEGSWNNMKLLQGICQINAFESAYGVNPLMRKESIVKMLEANNIWFKKIQEIKEDAAGAKNYFVYFLTMLNHTRVMYELQVYSNMVSVVKEIPGMPKQEIPDKTPMLLEMIGQLDKSLSYFETIGHIENECVSLSIKYELEHFAGQFENAAKTMGKLESLIENYELKELRSKTNSLKNGGTKHEQLKVFVTNNITPIMEFETEYERLVGQMKLMDETERLEKKKCDDCFVIHLFPIGFFEFPKSKKEFVYKMLAINDKKLCENLDYLFNESIVPAVNILNNPIQEGGILNGYLEEKGIESWRNIFRIRKLFFENKFFRNEKY